MPNSTWPSRRDASLITDAALAALLAGAELPPDSAPQLRPLAQTLAELAGQPAEGELDGEARTLTAFRNHFGASGPAQHAAPGRRPRLRPRHLPFRAVAAITTILGLGVLATAAYAGALPPGLQRLAHDIIGAPAAGTRPAARPPVALPSATSRPGYGLCAAWAQAKAHGTRRQRAAAFSELAAAADGPGHVSAYCAAAARTAPPSSRAAATPSPHSGRPAGTPAPQGPGRPSALPTPHGSGRPSALPTPHGSGRPSAVPTPHRSGRPSAEPTPHQTGTATVLLTARLAGRS